MTELRQRMIDDMRIRNLSQHTIEMYVRRVRDFARHFGKSPDQLGPKEIREYQVHMINKPSASYTMLDQTVSALRFLYKKTLKRDWTVDEIPHPRRPRRLPTVLSQEEVVTLLNAATNLKYRAIMTTIYAAGLRVSEVVQLKATDINSKRMMIRVCQGKGRKDRLVPLSPALLELLREYWRAYRPQIWLFPPRGRGTKPFSRRGVYRLVRTTAEAAGIPRRVSPHTLRHSYATHLLESGVNVRLIQRLLGHNSLRATETYTHVSPLSVQAAPSPYDALPSASS